MIFGIIDFKANKIWALFDEEKKDNVISYFKKLNDPEDFTVVTFIDNKEVDRCNLMDFN